MEKRELKKSVKIIIAFSIIAIIGIGTIAFIKFNQQFFAHYQEEINKLEKQEKQPTEPQTDTKTSEETNTPSEIPSETPPQKENVPTTNERVYIKATLENYCNPPYELKNSVCVSKITTEPYYDSIGNQSTVTDIYNVTIENDEETDDEVFKQACEISEGVVKVSSSGKLSCTLSVEIASELPKKCPSGYTLEENTCILETTINPSTRFACPSGYILENTLCYKN